MTGLPAGQKVEAEFAPSVWTDITADVRLPPGLPMRSGRTSEFSDPQVGSITVTLDNANGDYTPKLQLRLDGTAHPYYPNVRPGIRIRYSYTDAGTTYVRFVGYVNSWPPGVDSDGRRIVVLTANDRLDPLSRAKCVQAYLQEVQLDSPVALYTMGEAAGASAVSDSVGTSKPFRLFGTPALTGYATPIPVPDGLTGLQVPYIPTSAGSTLTMQAAIATGGAQVKTLECWIAVPGAVSSAASAYGRVRVIDAAAPSGAFPGMEVDGWAVNNFVEDGLWVDGTPFAFASTPNALPVDGMAHHLVVTADTPGGWSFYADGQFLGTLASIVPTLAAPTLELNAQFGVGSGPSVVFGPVAVYTKALTAARVSAHYAAAIGNPGELTGARIARFLSYAGLGPADMNIDPGRETCSAQQPVNGQFVGPLCQQVATTEGGGAVFYQAADGRMRFADRTFRKPGAPVLILDAEADLVGDAFATAFDRLTLINGSTVQRPGGTAQAFTDAASVAEFYPADDPGVTSYSQSDGAALNLAQYRVRSQCVPGLRLPQVVVDLVHATTPNLYTALAALEIGSRIRIVNLPPGVVAGTQLDVIFEGRSETPSDVAYVAAFDTSPADNPVRGLWGDPLYGCWQPDPGSMTLTAAITSAATSLSITTAVGSPAFTTNPARYPRPIRIGEEVISLNAPPSSGTSPQTFTGVTRGYASTQKARQLVNSPVSLWPGAKWTL